jgi:hypothetical protein
MVGWKEGVGKRMGNGLADEEVGEQGVFPLDDRWCRAGDWQVTVIFEMTVTFGGSGGNEPSANDANYAKSSAGWGV